jgi:putative ABC transport system ATP-binding protein
LPGTIEPTVSLLPPAASPARARNTIIHVKNVHKTYLLGVDGVPALRGVTLDIRRGEFIVILGKSGSGKTSMLNVLGTIDKPTKGDITLCDTVVNAKTTDDELAYLRLKKMYFPFFPSLV